MPGHRVSLLKTVMWMRSTKSLDPANPNLGPLIVDAFDYLERQYGVKSKKKFSEKDGTARLPKNSLSLFQ